MYLRFLVRPRRYRRQKEGIFRAEWSTEHDIDTLFRADVEACFDWFNKHLTVPDLRDSRAVFWFKENARQSMRRAIRIVSALQIAGLNVEQRITRNPGLIVFEDRFQVAAVPPSLVGIEL